MSLVRQSISWLRQPRVSLRWLMALVAIAAGLLGWRQHQVHQRLRAEYLRQAAICEMFEQFSLYELQTVQFPLVDHDEAKSESGQDFRRKLSGLVAIDSWEPFPERLKVQSAHWARLKAKYGAAARRPWLAIEPDRPSRSQGR